MIMFDECNFDYSSHGFKEYEQDGICLAEMNVDKDCNFKKGIYRIVSCDNLFICNQNIKKLKQCISKYLQELFDYLKIKKNATILLCGLGNENILADSFGVRVCDNVISTRLLTQKYCKYKLCSFCPSVSANTGILTFDIIKGVAQQVKTDVVILIDSLLTNNAKRLGHSFQLSSVGMAPGGAFGQEKEICFESINVPCITIGVPFMLDIKDSKQLNDNLIVTPKDIRLYICRCAEILGDVINSQITTLTKEEIKELKFGF